MQETILYKSPGGYMSVKTFGGGYYYAERKGIDSVAFILYNDKTKLFGLTNERKDPLDFRMKQPAFLTTAFGGSNDDPMLDVKKYLTLTDEQKVIHFTKLAIVEAKEEAGYTVQPQHCKFMGTYFVSTQMNQFCYLFLINVTELEEGEKDPQGPFEALAKTVWLNAKEVFATQDWKSQSIVGKFLFQ